MKIAGFESIVTINEFLYCQQVDEHEKCEFTAFVKREDVEKCKQQLGQKCKIENDDFRFCGIVTEILDEIDISGNYLKVTIMGQTIKFDKEFHNRVFQGKDKMFSDILKKTGMSENKLIFDKEIRMEPLIIQENETDWRFILRIAGYCDGHIFPQEEMWIGNAVDFSEKIKEADIINMMHILEINQCQIVCRLNKKLKFGSRIQYKGKKYFVNKIKYKKEHESYGYEYFLIEDNMEPVIPEATYYKLFAKVVENNDKNKLGRVKVEFLPPYEDVLKEKADWMECDSSFASKGLGIVCIPAVEDNVVVDIYNGNARVTAVKRTEPYIDKYKDCNKKYLFIDKDTYFEIDQDKIKFDNTKFCCEISKERAIIKYGDNTVIEISDESKVKSSSIEMEGKQKMNMVSSEINIKGKKGVNIN